MTFPLSLPQQQANNVANQFSAYIPQELLRYRQHYNSIFNAKISNPGTVPPTSGTLAPSDIITALGTNAGMWFTALTAHYNYLQIIWPSGLAASDVIPAYTVNSDGTVTLTPTS